MEAGLGNLGRTDEQALQDEVAGLGIELNFNIDGDAKVFHTEVFREGVTFEWVKSKVAIKLQCKYQDILLFYNGKRICEPFCLVDLGINKTTSIAVTIAEGAEIGLDKLR